jgi:hypothetical protein
VAVAVTFPRRQERGRRREGGDRRPHSRPRSLAINSRRSTLDPRPLVALAIAALALLALPATGLAQATDQYAPTTPEVGEDPTQTQAPITATDSGGSPPGDAEAATGGEDSGSGSGSETDAVAPAATTDEAATGTVAPTVADEPKNRDRGTVDGIGAGAEQQRETAEAAADTGASTNLARSDDGTGGMGIALYVLLGLTLVLAVGTGIARRRTGDGHPA